MGDELLTITLPVACWLRSLLEGESDGAGPLPGVAKLNIDAKKDALLPSAKDAWAAAKGSDEAAADEAATKFLSAAFGAGPARPAVAKALVKLLKLLQSGGASAALAEVSKMAR